MPYFLNNQICAHSANVKITRRRYLHRPVPSLQTNQKITKSESCAKPALLSLHAPDHFTASLTPAASAKTVNFASGTPLEPRAFLKHRTQMHTCNIGFERPSDRNCAANRGMLQKTVRQCTLKMAYKRDTPAAASQDVKNSDQNLFMRKLKGERAQIVRV
uniref:Uncharacterized protein n=1 Tax=Spironucleus salmonicida TaxID=348837 RepID=V6LSU6_9EUKA|eukprot:EST47328.1 Hypothetical protein SS50377_12596 [Spironucleus salmonicida]